MTKKDEHEANEQDRLRGIHLVEGVGLRRDDARTEGRDPVKDNSHHSPKNGSRPQVKNEGGGTQRREDDPLPHPRGRASHDDRTDSRRDKLRGRGQTEHPADDQPLQAALQRRKEIRPVVQTDGAHHIPGPIQGQRGGMALRQKDGHARSAAGDARTGRTHHRKKESRRDGRIRPQTQERGKRRRKREKYPRITLILLSKSVFLKTKTI